MKLFKKMKDGGDESSVTGYWLVEIKSLFSIVLLRFEGKTRSVFHSHAFNCFSWCVSGGLTEGQLKSYSSMYVKFISREPSLIPFVTKRTDCHMVEPSLLSKPTWVLSFRGPWNKTWSEFNPQTRQYTKLGHGREIIEQQVWD